MKNLLASTAIAVVSAGAALADTHSLSPFTATASSKVLYASDLVGARLYVSESENRQFELRAEWDDVGEINDIVVGQDGMIQLVLVDIGGFLGIGEKRIAVSMNALNFVSDGHGRTDYFVVLEGNRAALEEAPMFNRTAATRDDNLEAVDEDAQEMASTETLTNPDPSATTPWQRPQFIPPMIEREGYETASVATLTIEEVTGVRVYDAKDEWVGEVNSLVMAQNGQMQEAIIDVGGFLGIGEKQISLNMDELTIKRGPGGLRVYLDTTEEQLDQMPEWQG